MRPIIYVRRESNEYSPISRGDKSYIPSPPPAAPPKKKKKKKLSHSKI